MSDLVAWYRGHEKTLHPIDLAAQFHYRFILIHPFLDGNGRTARLLTNLILLAHDYPLGVIIRADSPHRAQYVGALQAVDASVPEADLRYDNPDLRFFPLVDFLSREVLRIFDEAIEILENPKTPEELAARLQRLEQNVISIAGVPTDEADRRRLLAEAVTNTTERVHDLLHPMIVQANAGLKELSFGMVRHIGKLADFAPSNLPEGRVVDRTTKSRWSSAGLIRATVQGKQGSTLVLPIPPNRFAILIGAEPHRLNIWTVLLCELDKGATTADGNFEDWSGHLAIPTDLTLFRETKVRDFLLKELARFIDVVESELQRRMSLA
jgi:hypothetical protein